VGKSIAALGIFARPGFGAKPQSVAARRYAETRLNLLAMSPRIIDIPLSGGDRKAQAKGIRRRTASMPITTGSRS
jgi:hypothetical protein